MITIELVEEAWANFDKYKETAEQHEFPTLLLIDSRFVPLYNDLHANWDDHHALVFMRGMELLSKRLGFKCPAFEKE